MAPWMGDGSGDEAAEAVVDSDGRLDEWGDAAQSTSADITARRADNRAHGTGSSAHRQKDKYSSTQQSTVTEGTDESCDGGVLSARLARRGRV